MGVTMWQEWDGEAWSKKPEITASFDEETTKEATTSATTAPTTIATTSKAIKTTPIVETERPNKQMLRGVSSTVLKEVNEMHMDITKNLKALKEVREETVLEHDAKSRLKSAKAAHPGKFIPFAAFNVTTKTVEKEKHGPSE